MNTSKISGYALLIVLGLCCNLTFAQLEEANSYFAQQKWSKANAAYSTYLKNNQKDSLAWYRLGVVQLNSNDYEGAEKSFNQAKATNFNRNFASFGLVKAYLHNGKTQEALDELSEQVSKGLPFYAQLKQDSVFNDLRDLPEFQGIVTQVKLNAFPCLSNEINRHFDFWIGEWDVMVNGNKVGENRITMAEGGCAIHENYTTARNYSGQSINYYDPQDEKWHQTWVDNTGVVLDYIEIDKAEGMLKFQCDYLSPRGQKVFSRLTFTANHDGTVRQFFESSTDGKEWQPSFDGLYVKRQ